MAKSVLKGLEQFEGSADELMRQLALYRAEVGKKALNKYAATAGRYAPPNMAKGFIEDRFYHRPIIYLKKQVESGQNYKLKWLDITKLRAGYRFRVNVRPEGQGLERASEYPMYFKTKAEAESVTPIKRRGYLKWSFGVGLMQWGAKVPPWIKTLESRSPALKAKRDAQTVLLTDEDDVLRGVMRNFAMPKNTSFAGIATRRAEAAVGKLLAKETKKLEALEWNF